MCIFLVFIKVLKDKLVYGMMIKSQLAILITHWLASKIEDNKPTHINFIFYAKMKQEEKEITFFAGLFGSKKYTMRERKRKNQS